MIEANAILDALPAGRSVAGLTVTCGNCFGASLAHQIRKSTSPGNPQTLRFLGVLLLVAIDAFSWAEAVESNTFAIL